MNGRAALRPLRIAPAVASAVTQTVAPAATPGGRPLADAPSVRLHIGSLALHGVAPTEGRRIASAFERELHHLMTSQPLPLHSAEPAALRLPPLQRAAGERPETTGRRLARLVALQWQGGAS